MAVSVLRRRAHLVAGLVLAAGLGVLAAAGSLRQALTPAALPYPHADRLVTLIAGSKSWSGPMLDEVARGTTVFDRLSAIQERSAVVAGDGALAETVRLESVSSAYFEMLGVPPRMGRTIDAAEDRRDVASRAVVVSDRLWRTRLGADPSAVGRSLGVDGQRLVIVGVMPPRFGGLIGRTDLWVSIGTSRWLTGETGPERPWSRRFEVFGRLVPGLGPDEAEARFAVEGRAAIERTGAADRILGGAGRLRLVPLADARVTPLVVRSIGVLGWAAGALLLFVLATVASLAILAADRRRTEYAVRQTLGASRARLVMASLRESSVVVALGCAGAAIVRPVLVAAVASVRPSANAFGIVTAELATGRAVGVGAGAWALVLAGAAVGAAMFPLAVLWRTRGEDLASAAGPRGGRIDGGLRLWRSPALAFVAVQTVVACAVLSAALLMGRSTLTLLAADRGYEPRGVTTARVALPDAGYDAARSAAFHEALAARLGATPGIEAVGLATCAPGAGRCRRSNLERLDGEPLEPARSPTVGVHAIGPRFFDVIGAALLRGRRFIETDDPGAPRVVIVSDRLASELWPSADPLGRTLDIFTANGSLAGSRTVVGIVRQIRYGVDDEPGGDVYLPFAQAPSASAVVFVRSPLGSREVRVRMAEAVAALDPGVPVDDAATLEARLGRSLQTEWLLLRAFAVFAISALVLAATGTFTIAAQAVERSRQELGVRIALGATPGQVWRLVGARGLTMAFVASGLGAAVAASTAGVLGSLLHGLPPRDLLVLCASPAIVTSSLLLALARPAWRAGRLDPVAAMRGE